MLRKEVQAGGYRVNAERSDPPESHVCVLTMSMISAWWTTRSMSAVVVAAFGKMLGHSVTIVGRAFG